VVAAQVLDCDVESVKGSPETAIASYRRQSTSKSYAETYVVDTSGYPYSIYKSTVGTMTYDSTDPIVHNRVQRYDANTAAACGRKDPSGDDYIHVTKIGISQLGAGHPYSHALTVDETADIETEPTFTTFSSHRNVYNDVYIVGYAFYNGPPDYVYAQLYSLLGISIIIRPQNHSRQMDASLDDEYLYIAALNPADNTPLVVKFAADLSADGTNVYSTSSGTEAEVFCSDQDSLKVWTAGDYGEVKAAVTLDAGISWEMRNPTDTGVARPFLVGPHSDNFLYDFVRPGSGHYGGGTIYHTTDGIVWSGVYTASGGFTANCCDNALSGEYEAAFAAYSDTVFRVLYTPDGFSHIEDITLTLPDLDATDIIIPY
jgi:hypothetical protein